MPESSIARSPASIPRSRNDLSHSSPKAVSPIPITATSRISRPPHYDLPPVLRVRRVVERHAVLHHGVHRARALLQVLDLVRHREVERVAPRPGAVPDREDPVPGLRDVEDRAQPDHDRAAVRVPDLPHEEARVDLLVREPELLPHPERELTVRLVEHRVVVVGGLDPRLLGEELRAREHVLEVRGLSREPPAMARVPLPLPP